MAQKKDVRWFYAGVAASTVAVIGGTLAVFPTWIVGNNAPLCRILLQCFGCCSCAFAVFCITVVNSPRLLFIVSLQLTLRRNRIHGYNHWDEIIPGSLILGAIPSYDHVKHLAKPSGGERGITSVVTLLQEHELVSSPFYRPAVKKDWEQHGVNVLWIITEDYEPVKPTELIRGADYINEQIEQGGKVYVHCKAGRGRSSACCAVYFVKYCGMSFNDAFDFMLSKRKQIHLNKRQRESVLGACAIIENQK